MAGSPWYRTWVLPVNLYVWYILFSFYMRAQTDCIYNVNRHLWYGFVNSYYLINAMRAFGKQLISCLISISFKKNTILLLTFLPKTNKIYAQAVPDTICHSHMKTKLKSKYHTAHRNVFVIFINDTVSYISHLMYVKSKTLYLNKHLQFMTIWVLVFDKT